MILKRILNDLVKSNLLARRRLITDNIFTYRSTNVILKPHLTNLTTITMPNLMAKNDKTR